MDKLTITHNAGFFSCNHIRLENILNFIKVNTRLPQIVDSSAQFNWYKINKSGDITFDYFENYENININIDVNNTIITSDCREPQFSDYRMINFKHITPFIKKYFTPSKEIYEIINNIEEKYKLNYDNICVLFYRENDKNRETNICSYDEYIKIADSILLLNPTIQFLIQSDETEFIDKISNQYPNNSFYFKNEIRHIKKCNNTVDIVMRNLNYEFSKKYLAITIIMSKCKYIVCGSGNCSIWILFYRGNVKNIFQNLNNEWIICN